MERKVKGHVKPTRSVSSNRWMHEHVTDPFVQQAKKLGYRSRSAFKIIEVNEKFHLFRRGMVVASTNRDAVDSERNSTTCLGGVVRATTTGARHRGSMPPS